MSMPGLSELMIILLIVLLLFGGRKIPEIARGIGRGIREFRKARDELMDEVEGDQTENRKRESPPVGQATGKSGPDQPGPEHSPDEDR